MPFLRSLCSSNLMLFVLRMFSFVLSCVRWLTLEELGDAKGLKKISNYDKRISTFEEWKNVSDFTALLS